MKLVERNRALKICYTKIKVKHDNDINLRDNQEFKDVFEKFKHLYDQIEKGNIDT